MYHLSRDGVLIETLWNVKWTVFANNLSNNYVLIETLWNVKKKQTPTKKKPTTSINRNIVECKAQKRIYVLRFPISY